MGDDVNQINPSTIDTAMQSFQSQGDQMQSDLATVAGSGTVNWGIDLSATVFSSRFQPAAQAFLDAAKSVPDGLHRIADHLHETAATARDLNSATTIR